VSVVNIDNGFGAAVQADMINKLAVGADRKVESRG
jgi:NCAIR mutase (PurE)-related protein